jgi:four helix bundle protein
MQRSNVVKDKSFELAVNIVKLAIELQQKKEFVLSKQIIRSGSSVGAIIREAEHAESRADFIHKFGIAQKEINETLYWLELLQATNFISIDKFEPLSKDVIEIRKIITRILLTTKEKIGK